MPGVWRLERQSNPAWCRMSGEYRRLRSIEWKRTNLPQVNRPPSPPSLRRVRLLATSFRLCRQYGDAKRPYVTESGKPAPDPGSGLREIRALKACNFESLGIDHDAVIASGGFNADVSLNDV